jgi:ParB-like chromosome segregation protein Spo0J
MGIPKITPIESQLVNPNKIEDFPGPYCMSFGFDIRPLAQSIDRVGLVNCPLVIENKNAELTVIVGYRRIHALKTLGWDRIPCGILSESEVSPLECLLLNLYDNLATRKLNEVEKGMVLNRLYSQVPGKKMLEVYMPLLELPSHESTLLFFIKLEQDLDTEIKEYLVQKKISLQTAKMLLSMEPDERSHVFNYMSNIKFNINQQKQFIDNLIDLSEIENKPSHKLLNEPSLRGILVNKQLNNPQKAKAILKFLRGRRFPSLVKAEKAFKKKVSSLDLPKSVSIYAPPYFEEPHYRLEVLFRQGKELRETINRLTLTEDLDELGDPWEKDV